MLTLHSACFVFEMGVVACTLVGWFAGNGSPRDAQDASRASELGVTIASICTTFLAFGITMVGADKVIRAARATFRRIRSARGVSISGVFSAEDDGLRPASELRGRSFAGASARVAPQEEGLPPLR